MRKLFYFDDIVQEEINYRYMENISSDTDNIVLTGGKLKSTDSPQKKFTAFVDGTMRLYKIASSAYTSTPFYVSVLSTALLVRDKIRQLRDTPYSRVIYVVLFPFTAYRNFIKSQRENYYEDLRIWEKNIPRSIKYVSQNAVFIEKDLVTRDAWEIFRENGAWIITDTSIRGISSSDLKDRDENKKHKTDLIEEEELFNPSRVKDVAKTRTRNLMEFLEFYTMISYLKENTEGYVMADGVFSPYSRIKNFFRMSKEEYNKYTKNIVGFIKHPHEIPASVLAKSVYLTDGEYVSWTMPFDRNKENDRYNFAVLRYRSMLGEFVPSPVGIIKLQANTEEDITDVINAVMYEKYPLPTDRRRLYNESFPIQVAEDVAKSRLPSEERIIGYVRSMLY